MSVITKHRWLYATTAGVVGLGLAVTAATAASADPFIPGTNTPDVNRPLDGVGSDTTQDLNNGLASRVVDGNGNLTLGSWDATGSATIQTRNLGPTFVRPNGSGNGVTALRAAKTGGSWNGVTLSSADLQFARSSSGPNPAAITPTGTYSYIPLAVDAVTYASADPSTSFVPRNIPLGDEVGEDTNEDGNPDLTLRNIYSLNAADVLDDLASGELYSVGAQNSGADIVPFIPQAGSGTRSFWQSELFGTGSFGTLPVATYTDGSGTHDVQEHDGSVTVAVPNAIVPFSVAQWLAQSRADALEGLYGTTILDRRHGAVLHDITIDGTAVSPIIKSVLNTSFPIVRPVFTVVQHAELGTNANLSDAFEDDQNTTNVTEGAVYTATSDDSTFTIEDFGFGSLINRGTGVNGVTIDGVLYRAGDAESFRIN